jgi:hypothetical protein
VSLKIYNVLGEEVATLVNENQKPGRHKIVWNAERLPRGIYYSVLEHGNTRDTGKLVLQ